MNAKKMTLTLSTLLILVQPSYAGYPLTLVAGGAAGCVALATILKRPDNAEMNRLNRDILQASDKIKALQNYINGQISADGEFTEEFVGKLKESLGLELEGDNGTSIPLKSYVCHISSGLKELGVQVHGRKASDKEAGVVGIADLLYALRAEFYGTEAYQDNPPISGFKQITTERLAAIVQEMGTIKEQIAALEGARGGQGDAPVASQRDLQSLQEQFAKDLAQFKIDLDELQKRIDAEAGRLTALEEAKLNDRLKALEDAPVASQKDLQALQALLEAQLPGFRRDLDKEAAARALSEERLKQLEENNALFEKRFGTHASVSDQFAARLAALEAAASKSTTSTGLPTIRKKWSKQKQADDAKPADAGADARDDN